MQTIIPLNHAGYCYEKLHFITKYPFSKKYEVVENGQFEKIEHVLFYSVLIIPIIIFGLVILEKSK